MESVSGGMLTCDDPTPVPIAYCVIVPGKQTQVWNWTTNAWEPMPASDDPAKAHLRPCEPLFTAGLASQLRCDVIPNVDPTSDQQIVLMYRLSKTGDPIEYAGHTVPRKYPDTFTFEFNAKS